MTNQERAEKILLMCQLPGDASAYGDPRNGLPGNLREDIIRELDEAVREAKNKCDHDSPCCDTCIDKFRAQGFSDAREMAIEICDPCGYTDCKHDRCGIAERIRALTPDEGIRQKEE